MVHEAELVASARRGNHDSFAKLFKLNWNGVVKRVRRIVGDYHAAQDVAQEAFVRAHKQLWSLGEDTRFSAWIHRIARNLALDRLRTENERRLREIPDSGCWDQQQVRDHAPEEHTEELRTALWHAIQSMCERDRRLLVLRYARGMSYRQIASECGETINQIKVSLHRGRQKLGNVLQGQRRSA